MSPIEFLTKYWDWVLLGFMIANTIVQKTKWKGDDDILTWIKNAITWIFTSRTPGKLPAIIIGLFFMMPVLAFAGSDVTFEWDSNTEPDMSHYNIYRSADQSNWIKVNADPILHTGTGTETWTEVDVSDGTWYWYATAVDTEDLESQPSNIISATLDTQAPAPPQNFVVSLIKKILAWITNLFRPLRVA